MPEELADKFESPALGSPEPLDKNEDERVDDQPDEEEEEERRPE